MGHAGSVNRHVASICPISWTKKLTFFPTRTTTRACLEGALFLSKITRSWNLGTIDRKIPFKIDENTSNNIPIPIKIPPKWMGGSKYMVGWPAGLPDFSKKSAAGASAMRG